MEEIIVANKVIITDCYCMCDEEESVRRTRRRMKGWKTNSMLWESELLSL